MRHSKELIVMPYLRLALTVLFLSLAGSVMAEPFSVDSSLGDLLDDPAARAVLDREMPGMTSNPAIAQAREISLRMIGKLSPGMLTEAKLAAINAELAKVSNGSAVNDSSAFTFRTIQLWERRAPGATGDTAYDKPTLTVVPVTSGAPKAAVIVAPGGGYRIVALGSEGRQVADWFATHGIVAFVLTYRLTTTGYHHPTQLRDAQRAIRWVRAHAEKYHVDPSRIGMIGFSAGGHLTAMASTLFDAGDPNAADPVDRLSSRPDFAILGYAPTQMSERNDTGVAGPKPTPATLRELSPVQNVTTQTPPTFIFQASDDAQVPTHNSTAYYDALRNSKVPAELHLFMGGRHGFGMGQGDLTLGQWPVLLERWLTNLGILGAAAVSAPPPVR
jgi:acetyl esterase/lipase